MKKGRIVYLSGLTSTGKSSIVKALQARTDCLWCALGFDLFEEALPVWAADDSALYAKAIRAMYAAAKSFSDQGLDVLIDGFDEEYGQFFGRTYADSPEIDGRVWIASQEPLHEGDFVRIHVDGCLDGDLTGYCVEEV